MKTIKYSLITLAALALTITPNLATAQNTPQNSGHVRNVSYHDRTPRVHDHTPVAHR